MKTANLANARIRLFRYFGIFGVVIFGICITSQTHAQTQAAPPPLEVLASSLNPSLQDALPYCISFDENDTNPVIKMAFSTNAFENGLFSIKPDEGRSFQGLIQNVAVEISQYLRTLKESSGESIADTDLDVVGDIDGYADGNHYYRSHADRDANRLDLNYSLFKNTELAQNRVRTIGEILTSSGRIKVREQRAHISQLLETDKQFDQDRTKLRCDRRRRVVISFSIPEKKIDLTPTFQTIQIKQNSYELSLKPDFVHPRFQKKLRNLFEEKFKSAIQSSGVGNGDDQSAEKIFQKLVNSGQAGNCPYPYREIALAYIDKRLRHFKSTSFKNRIKIRSADRPFEFDFMLNHAQAMALFACLKVPPSKITSPEMFTTKHGSTLFSEINETPSEGKVRVGFELDQHGESRFFCAHCHRGITVSNKGVEYQDRLITHSHDAVPGLKELNSNDPWLGGSWMAPRVWVVTGCNKECTLCGGQTLMHSIEQSYPGKAKLYPSTSKVYSVQMIQGKDHLSVEVPTKEFQNACVVQSKLIHTCGDAPRGKHPGKFTFVKSADEIIEKQIEIPVSKEKLDEHLKYKMALDQLICSVDGSGKTGSQAALPSDDEYSDCGLDASKRIER